MLLGSHLFGCICVPDFPVQAVLRTETALSFQAGAVALLDGPESLLKVFACNAPARRAGVAVGMTKAQAEVSPHVVLRKRVVEQEQAAHAALLECGYSFSPRIESTCPGTVIVDLTGAERLLGIAEEIGRQLADRAAACGLTVNVGLAGNPDSAQHAARGIAGITVVPLGREANCLSRLPVEVLQPDTEILDTLESWGIRDFKSLAALPEIQLTQRLGQYGLHLQRLAKGEVRRELVPAEQLQVFQESMELDEPVDLLEPLAFVLNRLLEQLMTPLLERSLATDHARVVLELEIHHDRQVEVDDLRELPLPMHERTLKVPAPTQDTKILLKLLQLDLEANPPQGPVKKVTVEVFAARLRLGQAGLFQPSTPEPAKLEITLARLRAVVGNEDEDGRGCVGFPQVLDSHKPDSFQMRPSMPERNVRKSLRARKQMHKSFDSPSLALGLAQDDKAQRSSDDKTPRLAMKRFRPPLAAIVELSGAAPRTIIFSGMRAKVRNASGPWRVSGSWWDQAEQWERDEWDVEISTEGGMALYRMFREVRSGQWFVEGMYD
jgi:protein ImuB